MRRIVSVTPVALERDSRTIKIACSFARAGYESVVVEGAASQRAPPPSIRLLTLHRSRAAGLEQAATNVGPEAPPLPLWRRCLRPLAQRIRRSPAAEMLDLWTLALHLRALWQRTGPGVARLLPRADLYYVHAYELAPAVFLRRGIRLRPTPIIYDAHDLYQELLLDGQPSRFVRRYLAPLDRFGERSLCRGAAAVVTTSAGMARAIGQRYRCRPEVVRNCHDDRLDDARQLGLRSRLSLPPSVPLSVVVGNRKPGHSLGPLVKAVSRAGSELHVAFVGAGYEGVPGEFGDERLNARLHVVGRVAADAIVPTIRDADFSILPYAPSSAAYTAFLPNGFFQSVAAGLPVLYPCTIAAIADLAHRLEIGEGVDTESIDDLARALGRMERRECRSRYKQRVLRAKEQLSWQREERVLLSIVERVLDRAA